MTNIAVFASGTGSNFLAIARAVKKGCIKARLAILICDKPYAPVIEKAEKLKIKTILINRGHFSRREDFEEEIKECLEKDKINLVVLAGFMRILSPQFVNFYKNMILNIHPSILPSFTGENAIKQALDYGCKVTGVTVHFVDEETDHGPIILQETVAIKNNESVSSLERKIHKIEHKLYPMAIKLFVDKKLKVDGRQVRKLP